MATALLQYTPELAVVDTRSMVLDVGASLSLYKGPRNLYRCIQASLQRLDVQATISMAPTAMGAWLLAGQNQTRQRRVLRQTSLEHQLDALYTSQFPPAAPYLDWLDAIGCLTLKQLKRLPRMGLRERTSELLVRMLDSAYGKTSWHLHWYQPPDVFHASSLLDFHTAHTHAVLAVAGRLIEQLCGWLQARQHGASSMQFSLHHEKGRHACPPSRITLGLSTPSRHADDFFRLLKERLQHEQLHAPVISIELHKVHSQPESEPSGELFPDRSQRRHQEGQLIDLLCARLGPDKVLQPTSLASHLPEHANRWSPVKASTKGDFSKTRLPSGPTFMSEPTLAGPALSASKTQGAPTAAKPPFWILDHPLHLETHNERPQYKGQPLQLIQGPDRIESGWWINAQQEQRDYFIACDARHRRYWIYRQRGSDAPSWFLHGIFA